MLKRSKTDDDHRAGGEAARNGPVLVVNEDQDACELVARLVEHAGLSTTRSFDLDGVVGQLEADTFSGVVVDSLGGGISSAFKVLDAVRAAGPRVQDTPVIILAASDTNRLYAFQSGVDDYVVRPFHADDLIAALQATLGRSPGERTEYRRAQLMGDATTA